MDLSEIDLRMEIPIRLSIKNCHGHENKKVPEQSLYPVTHTHGLALLSNRPTDGLGDRGRGGGSGP